jgi:hypothetical protein
MRSIVVHHGDDHLSCHCECDAICTKVITNSIIKGIVVYQGIHHVFKTWALIYGSNLYVQHLHVVPSLN